MDWTDVFKGVVSPVHADREGQSLQNFRYCWDDFLYWAADFFLGHIDVFFALDFTESNVLNRQALATDKAFGSLGKVPISIQCNFLRRAFEIFGQIRLLVRQANHAHCQTTRRREHFNFLKGQTMVCQEGSHLVAQLLHARCHDIGWHFLQA